MLHKSGLEEQISAAPTGLVKSLNAPLGAFHTQVVSSSVQILGAQ